MCIRDRSNPFLYEIEVITNGDTYSDRFGMRTFYFDPETKLPMLNGKVHYLNGTNIAMNRFYEDLLRADHPFDPCLLYTSARADHQVFQLFPCNFAAFIESSVTSVLFQQFFQQENPSFLHPAGDSFFSYFNPAGSSLQGHSPLNPYVYIEFLYIFYLRNTTYIALFLRVSSPILCEFYAISHRVHSSLTQEFLLKYSKCYILNYIS